MDFFKKHGDAVIVSITVLTSMFASMIWINSKFNEIEKDIAIIKTVLIMRNILPESLAKDASNE